MCLQAAAKLLIQVPKLFEETRLVVRGSDAPENTETISGIILKLAASVCQLLSKFSAPISQILLDEGMDCGEYQMIIRPDLQVCFFKIFIFSKIPKIIKNFNALQK